MLAALLAVVVVVAAAAVVGGEAELRSGGLGGRRCGREHRLVGFDSSPHSSHSVFMTCFENHDEALVGEAIRLGNLRQNFF